MSTFDGHKNWNQSTPWKACSRDEIRRIIVRDSDGLGIAHVFGLIDAETDANARLIAAAPDLLAALQRAAALLARYPDHTDTWRDCRAAIARATGEA